MNFQSCKELIHHLVILLLYLMNFGRHGLIIIKTKVVKLSLVDIG